MRIKRLKSAKFGTDRIARVCTGVGSLRAPRSEGNMFTVYLKSAGTKKYFTEFETEAEAESFCREYGWEWVDENEFVWDMDYEEVRR